MLLGPNSSPAVLLSRYHEVCAALIDAHIDHSQNLVQEKHARASALTEAHGPNPTARAQEASVLIVSEEAAAITSLSKIRELEVERDYLVFVINAALMLPHLPDPPE